MVTGRCLRRLFQFFKLTVFDVLTLGIEPFGTIRGITSGMTWFKKSDYYPGQTSYHQDDYYQPQQFNEQ
jgi:hypothetical protein